MITNEAYKIFKKAHPDLEVRACCFYDNRYFIFTALPKGVEIDYNDPFYAVDKKTGIVSNFSPAGNIAKWAEAMRLHQKNWR